MRRGGGAFCDIQMAPPRLPVNLPAEPVNIFIIVVIIYTLI